MIKLLNLPFDVKEFLQLLKNKEILKGEKRLRYLKYRAFLLVQFNFKYREKFLTILENYENNEISRDILLNDFLEYERIIGKISNQFFDQILEEPTLLDNFQIYSNAEEFSRKLTGITALDEDLLDNALNPRYDFDTSVKETYNELKRLTDDFEQTLLSTGEQLISDSFLVSEEKFDHNVIPRLIWLSSVISLGLILIGSF
jgi:hypothetical protein